MRASFGRAPSRGCTAPMTVSNGNTSIIWEMPRWWPDWWKTTVADATPDDNTFVLKATVTGSYDPNDKQVWPAFIKPAQIASGEPLLYTIRFQNTGTYPAERVRLVDTLDARLDLASLQVISASHSFTWRILGGHVLEVLFDQIQLPDSLSNEAGNHGFFSFSIKGKPYLLLGERLRNRAYIYFDFNSPVVTNTVVTEVSGCTEPSCRHLSDSMAKRRQSCKQAGRRAALNISAVPSDAV